MAIWLHCSIALLAIFTAKVFPLRSLASGFKNSEGFYLNQRLSIGFALDDKSGN